MKHLLLGIGCIITTTVFAQKTLKGKLIAAVDKQPVAAASVFLSNTTIGTASQEDGSFVIRKFPEGQYYLVVTSTDYEPRVVEVNAAELSDSLIITLTRKIDKINNVTIGPFVKKGWKTWGEFFMAQLMGETPNAKECKLLNKDAVQFRVGELNAYQRILQAVATEPLIIENKALGYRLTYDLAFFEMKLPGGFVYNGHPLFKEMEAPDEKTKAKWLQNRKAAYEGSLMHFMRSLYRNQLKEEGFTVKRIAKLYANVEPGEAVFLTGDSITYSLDSNKVQLQFNNLIEVVYAAKQVTAEYVKAITYPMISPATYLDVPGYGKLEPNRVHVMNLPASVAVGKPLTSQLKFRKPSEGVQVLHNGSYVASDNLILKLYWEWSEKLSNLLPLDYGNPEPVNAQQVYKPQ